MRYAKPALTLEQQADQLLARGMKGDKALMIQRLSAVNYYRLSGYWFPLRKPNPADPDFPLDTFQDGTTFDSVWNRYVFDRRLRLLIMDAIERVEVAVRTQLSYHHAHLHGPFAYATNAASLPKLRQAKWHEFINRVQEETGRSREQFLESFRAKYGDCHSLPPIWIATEIMAFGTTVTLFLGMEQNIKRAIALRWDVPDTVFESWLHTLNSVRNICAHHGRLWNRLLPTKPLIPNDRKYPQWHAPATVDKDRVFSILTICKWSLDRIAPQSQWPRRLVELLDQYPDIPRTSMGFPADWRTCPIWRGV